MFFKLNMGKDDRFQQYLEHGQVAKFDAVLGWVTICGLGLSELCLALHLLAFALSPDLRNLSGRNLASLSLALFAAYGSFMAAQVVETGGTACLAVSTATFYFFLCAFWWTSVLAWDVWRTIRMATVQLRSSSGKQWGKFALYSLYAWLVPALIVAATLVIDLIEPQHLPWIPDQYRPHLGRQVTRSSSFLPPSHFFSHRNTFQMEET